MMRQRKKFLYVLLAVMVVLLTHAMMTTFMEGGRPYERVDGEAGSRGSANIQTFKNIVSEMKKAEDEGSFQPSPREESGETGRKVIDHGTSGDGVGREMRDKDSGTNPNIISSKYPRLEDENENNSFNNSSVMEKLRVRKVEADGWRRAGEELPKKEYDGQTSDASTRLLTNSLNQTSPADANLIKIQNFPLQKTVLFYSTFFYGPWQPFFKNRILLKEQNCPVSSCTFVFNSSHPEDADAVIFHDTAFNINKVPRVRRPHQRYIWLNLEAPDLEHSTSSQTRQKHLDKTWMAKNRFFNWTYTYHRDSDLLLLYGGLRSLRGERDPPRPGLLDTSGYTYRDYMADLDRNHSLQDDQDYHWSSFLNRPKLVAWMVSHCSTKSGREFYVRELQKYLSVDVYGLCGDLRCGKTHIDWKCYSNVLRPTYKFYLAFENSMCIDYITEKVWLPLRYGLVPVVYGGANYSSFLPPHSYIDATRLTPLQLAHLLTRVGNSSLEYGRYHLWRRYWQVLQHPALCELCQRLHEDDSSSSQHDLAGWWSSVNHCFTRYPRTQYPRPPEPDPRTFREKFRDMTRLFGSLMRLRKYD